MTGELFSIQETPARELDIARREFAKACEDLEIAENAVGENSHIAVLLAEKVALAAQARLRRAESAELRRWKK